ncbi:importin-13 [Prorops nasuta]|uniref:importin-13 n=1 Tax=Prorops nasuta TaxID=863751 RepID=UPI0034CEB03B
MDHAVKVEQAIKQFYATGNNEIHNWLLQVQASPEAWEFVWLLLGPSKSWEVQFFAATTLHTKISKQWHQIPRANYSTLEQCVLEALKQPNMTKIVLSKLCQTLAAIFVNSKFIEIEIGEQEKNFVERLMEVLPYDSLLGLELLLRVLTSIPTEFEKRQGYKCAKLREGLIGNWPKTAWFLQQVFSLCNTNGQMNQLYILALECTLAWLKIGQLPLDITGQIYSHLAQAASHYVPQREDQANEDNGKAWEASQDCLIMIMTHCELHKKPQTFWSWTRNIVGMARQYGGKYFCEILTAIGETHSRTLLIALTETENGDEMERWTSETLIELLLECSELEGRYPIDEKRSCIPFGFWYALQDDLTTLDPPLENQAQRALKPIYARLAQALLRKATLPLSECEAGDAEERELFRCYRQDAADTLDYCYRVLGQDLLMLLGQRLSEPMSSVEKWANVESTLHAFKALAVSIGTQESQYVPALLNLVLSNVPYDLYPREVLACACSTMGAYAEWIGMHPIPWLERVLQLITTGLLGGQISAPFASMALKDVARECDSHMAPFAPKILTTIGKILPNATANTAGEDLRLMYAAGKLINTLNTVDDQIMYLEATLGLCVMKIQRLLEEPISLAKSNVSGQLKMIAVFFSTLEGSIGKTVLDGVIPIFNKIVLHPEWSRDDATLKAMHTCAQKSLSTLLQPEIDAAPLVTILLYSYRTHPHPAALNLLNQLALLFGKDPNNIIGPVFVEMSSLTLSTINACKSVGGNLSDLSDLMEAYFALLAQICKKNATMLLRAPEQIPQMLQYGTACLVLAETGTTKAAGHFLTHAIMQSPHLQTFIQPVGQDIVFTIVRCIAGEIPRNSLEPHAEILLALNKTCFTWNKQWLQTALEKTSSLAVTITQRDAFKNSVLRERINKARLYSVLKDFSMLCRQQTAIL